MHALGDKVGSALIAQAAGVPTLAWSGSHVSLVFSFLAYHLIFSVMHYPNDTKP
jgi:biotin carboxylase